MWNKRSNRISSQIDNLFSSLLSKTCLSVSFLGVSQYTVVLQISMSPPTAFTFIRQLSPMKTSIFPEFLPHMEELHMSSPERGDTNPLAALCNQLPSTLCNSKHQLWTAKDFVPCHHPPSLYRLLSFQILPSQI